MVSRLVGVLYMLAAAWCGVVWYFFARVEPSIPAQLFMVAVIGLPPLLLMLVLDYIINGRR